VGQPVVSQGALLETQQDSRKLHQNCHKAAPRAMGGKAAAKRGPEYFPQIAAMRKTKTAEGRARITYNAT